MNANIEKNFDFQAAVHFDNSFFINFYHFTLSLDVITDSTWEQNIALQRVKYLVSEIFENVLFIQDTETEMIQKYQNVGLRLCVTPDEPFDQIISLLLLLKFNAVCENRLFTPNIVLTSRLGDGVKFVENIETAKHIFNGSAWYNDNTPNILLTNSKNESPDKIVKIKNNEWRSLGLAWSEKKTKTNPIVLKLDTEK